MVFIIVIVNIKKKLICKINNGFGDFEYELRENIFNELYLQNYCLKLVPYLKGLFMKIKVPCVVFWRVNSNIVVVIVVVFGADLECLLLRKYKV